MLRWWLIFVLATAPAVAWGQSAAQTEQAVRQVAAADGKVQSLNRQRADLVAKLQSQLAEVEALKSQKASWARNRELNSKQAEAKDTGDAIGALDKQLAAARDQLVNARRAELAAIDAELAAGATGARQAQLQKARALIAASQKTPKKIAMPSSEIDPSADADELEHQAAQLLKTESALQDEEKSLDQQASDLAEAAEVRKHHERANTLAQRDDDVPHRANQTSTTTGGAAGTKGGADQQPAPTGSPGNGAGSGSGGGTGSTLSGPDHSGTNTESFGGSDRAGGSFESEVAIVLGDVVDQATIDGLARASRSGDPAQRAEAARKTRDAVRAKLEQLKKKRALIEARAKQLRK